ncbi:MAG: hypothetical protein FWB83_10195 [Treponema sp.]|nr:hypothetical protein [Treponema sp.]
MTDIERKTGMTDAECEQLDNYYTENNFEPGQNLLELGVKPGFAHNILLINELDKEAAEYLFLKSKEFHKTKIEIINELIREKIAVGA